MNTPRNDSTLLDVRRLRVHFRRDGKVVRAVDGVDLQVRPGECVGLVGESGSGKTVLSRSIARLMPDAILDEISGEALFEGTDILALSEHELQRRRRTRFLSMVFQDPLSYLNPTRRVGQQVAEALPAGLSRRQRREQVAHFFTRVGLPGDRATQRRYPHEFSGGMRQRVLIAMALASSPRLLIADEPTTALDATVQIQVLNTLEKLHREQGMALLVITHDLALVAELCDRVYVMYGGQVVESGDVETVLKTPNHPYTRGLIASVPGEGAGHRGAGLVGSVPNLAALPTGCRFRPRCPHASERCEEMPPLMSIGSRGSSRCWLSGSEPAEDEVSP
ncbi:ABC transporter ATP-binding protein [Saccharopolyspora shandongensis]|uniref:ABC transporter ATP-binding protein n=1 Tax=Saccharopolyspora shandongensis TaxID=418495 RepID=UPI0033C95137